MKRKKRLNGIFLENINLIKRALSIISELTPHRLTINIIKAVIDSLTPYIAIFMSALIIDELAEERNLSVLIQYVLIT